MDLIIIRHGRPVQVANADGAADPELSEVGHAQAQLVGDYLAEVGVDHIVASPMVRALQTAAPLAARLEMEPEIVDGVAEFDRFDSSYTPAEIRRAEDPEAFFVDPLAERGAERDEFTTAVTTSFRSIIAANAGRRVAVFCHGMVTSVWFAHILGTDDLARFTPDYCGVSRFLATTKTDYVTVRSFNEIDHLGDTHIAMF